MRITWKGGLLPFRSIMTLDGVLRNIFRTGEYVVFNSNRYQVVGKIMGFSSVPCENVWIPVVDLQCYEPLLDGQGIETRLAM